MIQLNILSGKKAGLIHQARRFPYRIGRAPDADLRLEEAGVWDQHLQISLEEGLNFGLKVQPQALATVNGQPVEKTVLRNGDVIEIGALRLQFWLSPTRQRSLKGREMLTWVLFAAIALCQVSLIYWLLR